MTTVSDGSTPPGAGPVPGFSDTVEVPLPAAGLPAPPPLLSHLQPEAHATAATDGEAAPSPDARPRRRLPRDTPSGAGRVFLPIALCLLAVVALGAGWSHLEGERAAEAQLRLDVQPSEKPPIPSLGGVDPAVSPSASTSPSAAPSVSASPSSAPQPSASAPASPPSSTAPPAVPATPAADRSVAVVVLNATNRSGLAAEVALRLRAKGWTVVSVGNWRRGGIGTTTVFATGRAAAAATMRRDAKPADATRPTLDGMPRNRIVLVIGPDFPRLR